MSKRSRKRLYSKNTLIPKNWSWSEFTLFTILTLISTVLFGTFILSKL